MEVISIVSCLLSAACLVALFVLILKRKEHTQPERQLERLERTIEEVAKLSDYNARALENLSRSTEARLAAIQNRLTDDIKYIIETNMHNLEAIRRTVDEKLTTSIDGKLSESYARISDRLEKMYESVGEMKSLSANVSDIKRVFSNVKLRGTWGEAQLKALLEQTLAPNQYRASVKLNPLDNSLVDFAILLPAKNGTVFLPVDSKFPVECFERLCEAGERADREGEERARKELERAVKLQADSIAKKYILPPATTDFAVMYLPSEALYAEVLRVTGLNDLLRAKRVTVCGPTNFYALLATLQTGFRTAAIEKRSGELGRMLEQFRADFARFSEGLERAKRKLQEAQDTVEGTQKRSGAIGRELESFRDIALPPAGDDVP